MITRFFTAAWLLIARRQTFAIMAACVLLTVFIGILIVSNYRSQSALHNAGLKQFQLDIEKRAASLEYFFSERKYDLGSMAGSQEVNTYFYNKALGMSEQYGLKVNLFIIRRLFDKTLKDKKIQGDAIYKRFLLLDDAENPLVDTALPWQSKSPGFTGGLPASGQGEPAVSIQTVDGMVQIIVTAPCLYKNRLKGTLIAWLKTETLLYNFIDHSPNLQNKGFDLATDDGRIICSNASGGCSLPRIPAPDLLARISTEEFLHYPPASKGKQVDPVLLIRVPIINMPLHLLAWVKSEAYFGSPMPRHLIVGTGSLAIIILLCIGVLMRFNTQNRILKQQYEASERQQSLLAQKNRQLKEEIEKRHEAEQQLETQRTLQMRSDRLRSLGEMAAGIAHELNQPLVGVRGFAELLLINMDAGREIPDKTLRKNLNRIIEQADRMVHIINHVRLFAREAGNIETTVADLNDVVRSGTGLLATQFKSHGIVLEEALCSHPLDVCINPYSVEEVLLNLLANARDAVGKAHLNQPLSGVAPCVKISTGSTEQNGKHTVWMAVKDNGTGIDPGISDNIFTPFYTTKDPDKGTGLGLSICKSIVEEFGGAIRFDSSEEAGTVFTVEFAANIQEREKNEQT